MPNQLINYLTNKYQRGTTLGQGEKGIFVIKTPPEGVSYQDMDVKRPANVLEREYYNQHFDKPTVDMSPSSGWCDEDGNALRVW